MGDDPLKDLGIPAPYNPYGEGCKKGRRDGYKQGLLTALGIAKEYEPMAIGHVIVRKIEERLKEIEDV